MGKLLLALSGGDDDLESMLPDVAGGEAVGPNAITSVDGLRRELAAIRERGWAAQDEELAPNLRSLAVAVYSGDGIAGAVNIAVDGHRYSYDDMLASILPKLRRTASEISWKLGYLDAVR